MTLKLTSTAFAHEGGIPQNPHLPGTGRFARRSPGAAFRRTREPGADH